MKIIAATAVLALGLASPALAQIPPEAATLTWMPGCRTHTNANGSKVYEAFIGPANGVVTGTALSATGTAAAFTEYHRIGPNAEGRYGLSVANTRNNMVWTFTPLKAIEPGKITFATEAVTITYFSKPGGAMGAAVERGGTRTEYDFKAGC